MISLMRFNHIFMISVLWLGGGYASAFDLIYVASSRPELARPHDIALSADKRYLFVADKNNDRIAVLDANSLELLVSFGEDEVSEPHDLVFQSAGRLLVADTGNDRIAIYQVRGSTAKLTGELRGAVNRPEGVAVHRNGRVYVTGSSTGNIEVFENGQSVKVAGGLSGPHDISITAEGSLWVADTGKDRLVKMSEDLEVQQILEGEPYHFNGPRYLEIDQAGRLYIADKYSHQIKVIAPDRTLLFTLGSGHGELGPYKFDHPEGIAIDGPDVWISDTYNNRLVQYRIEE